jgi:hypothetical protein
MPESSLSTPLLTLSGVVLGYGIKAMSDWVQHGWDVKERKEAKLDKNWERREGFQRATLLELQEILSDMMRNMGAIYHAEVAAGRAGSEWRKNLMDEALYDESFRVMKRSNVLRVRVQDEQVRTLVKEMKDTSIGIIKSRDEKSGKKALSDMANVWDKLNERIGELLRKIDEQI